MTAGFKKALVVSLAAHATLGVWLVAQDDGDNKIARTTPVEVTFVAREPEHQRMESDTPKTPLVAPKAAQQRRVPTTPKKQALDPTHEASSDASEEMESSPHIIDSGSPSTRERSAGDPRARPDTDVNLSISPPPVDLALGQPPKGHDAPPPELEPTGNGTYQHVDRGFVANVARDGSVTFDGRSNVHFKDARERVAFGDFGQASGGAQLGFDLTEALMAAVGDDPFRYAKSRFLAETSELRAQMCKEAQDEDAKESLIALGSQLRRIWQDEAKTFASRRRLVFELWDQCEEDERGAQGAGASDRVRTVAKMARATVLAFVRREMPKDTAMAYPKEELLALNAARISRERFSPYGF